MPLTIDENAKQKLDAWIGRDTFHTGHGFDDARFYRFVAALWECNRTLIDESALRDLLRQEIERKHGKLDQKYIEKNIHDWVSTAQTILDYHLANSGTD